MNVEKNDIIRISKLPIPVHIMTEKKNTAECGIFQLLGKNNERCEVYI